MITSINNAGGTATCFSYNNPATLDVNIRWGASAKSSDGTKNWSVDSTGVVTWDTVDQPGILNWDAANTACATAGGRLPSIEQLKALYGAYNTTPTGFAMSSYWSGTTVPSDITSAYGVFLRTGGINYGGKTTTYLYVRCVR